MEQVAEIFGHEGIVGLVLFGLLVLVAYMVYALVQVIKAVSLINKETVENDRRLFDLKKTMYEADLLPERRTRMRIDNEL
jgi:hypothetical protein